MEPIPDGVYVVNVALLEPDSSVPQWHNGEYLLVYVGKPYLLRPDRTHTLTIGQVPPDARAIAWTDIQPPSHPMAPYHIPEPIPVLRPSRN